MAQNGGEHVPAGTWGRVTEQAESTKDRSFDTMLDPWIGCLGLKPIDPAIANHYLPFLKAIDTLQLVPSYFSKDGELNESAAKLRVTDLGSLLDINLINLYAGTRPQLTVLEVGGGYGRLTEAVFNVFGPKQVKYVMIDSVPLSLFYAETYLSNNLPNISVGSYYKGDPFDLEKFDIYIIPTWHFEKLNRYEYDLGVNIESLQEMDQPKVDYYLGLFDKVVKKDGLIYISNSHDYIFKGEWNYPKNWNCLFRDNSPRSWTNDHPAEIFVKDHSVEAPARNRLLQFAHEKHVETFEDLTAKLADLLKKYEELVFEVPNDLLLLRFPTSQLIQVLKNRVRRRFGMKMKQAQLPRLQPNNA